MRARRISITAAAALAILLTACNPIVIAEDGETIVESSASRAVDPFTTYVRGVATPGIQIRMRACQKVELRRPDGDPIDINLRPHAHVTDATGKVLYSSHDFPDQPQVRPAGSYENPAASDGSHHVVVPVGGAKTPLRIGTFCDSYTPGSHGLYPRWDFPTCTTSTRRCAASPKGAGEWHL